jgi:ubiquinone biosynthesis O-methyltransferase
VNNLEYICTTVEEHVEVVGDEYDAIVASEVIEHVDNPEIFVTKCSQVLKVDGYFFLKTINRYTRSWLLAIIGAEYV